MPASILIADDSSFVRTLLRELLEADYEIVGEAENGVGAVDLYDETDPDVVLMDVTMPIRDGIEATAEITETDPDATVIAAARAGEPAKTKRAVAAGADGCITKPFQTRNVVEAIDAAIPETR